MKTNLSFSDENMSTVEPKKYRFLLENSEYTEMIHVGFDASGNYFFVKSDEFKAAEIIGEMTMKSFSLPKKTIDDNFVAETDELVIIDFINVQLEDLKSKI